MNIELKNLSGGYKKGFKLKDISLSIPSGAFAGLIGPNGSGKSTLLKLMAGILKPECGKIKAGNLNVSAMKARDRSRIISYTPPYMPSLFPFSVYEMVLMGRNPYLKGFSYESAPDREKALRAMEKAGISKFKDRPVSDLSSGEKQKVLFARALCQEACVMLLDEPGSHLDIHHIHQLFKNLQELNRKGVTIVAALHDINLVSAYCSCVKTLKKGKIFSNKDQVQEIINLDSLQKLYGEGIRVKKVEGREYVLP